MYLHEQPPPDPSNIAVLVSACCFAGVAIGLLAFKGRDNIRRGARYCVASIKDRFWVWVAWITHGRLAGTGAGQAQRGPALPSASHVALSHGVGNNSTTTPTAPPSYTVYPPAGRLSMEESLPEAVVGPGTRCSSRSASVSHCTSPINVNPPAIATAADVDLWNASASQWGLIPASPTPCVSSVFEDDSEDDVRAVGEGGKGIKIKAEA